MTGQRAFEKLCPFSRNEPNEYDILCSKDKTYSRHPGNVLFREQIDRMRRAYGTTRSKIEKMRITKDIVSHLCDNFGSKFLKLEEDCWVEISDQAARDKVSHALRFASRSDRKRKHPRQHAKPLVEDDLPEGATPTPAPTRTVSLTEKDIAVRRASSSSQDSSSEPMAASLSTDETDFPVKEVIAFMTSCTGGRQIEGQIMSTTVEVAGTEEIDYENLFEDGLDWLAGDPLFASVVEPNHILDNIPLYL